MSKQRNRDLSDDTGSRIMQLVDNSMPNSDRPKLSDSLEQELEAVEHKAASLMAARENSQWKFNQAHKELMNELELLRQRLRIKYGHKNGKNGSVDK